MYDYEDGREHLFVNFEVQKYNYDNEGNRCKNPRKFPTKKGEKGLSIRVRKVKGMNKKEFLEVACYSEAYKEAVALKLKPFENITFCGKYERKEGDKKDFHNVTISDPMQIERWTPTKEI